MFAKATARTLLLASASPTLQSPARFAPFSTSNPLLGNSPPGTSPDSPNQPDNTHYTENEQTQGITGNFNAPKSDDVQNQPAKEARRTKEKGSGSPLDVASEEAGEKQLKGRKSREKEGLSGNPEGVGFVEQVGSGSGTAGHFERSR